MTSIVLIEYEVDTLDNGKCAGIIFLNFSIAFDTIDHYISRDNLQ